MKTKQGIVRVARWVALALAVSAFNPAVRGQSPVPDSFNGGADGPVYALALQPDGKILVGGAFTNLAGQFRTNIGRLNADGTLDPLFNPTANGAVRSLVVQPDGKILVGGNFAQLGAQGTTNIGVGRLNADGTLDPSFSSCIQGNPLQVVYSLALQSDGTIYMGGTFFTLNGERHLALARINSDGTLDASFDPFLGAIAYLNCVALQTNSMILAGGSFDSVVSGVGAFQNLARFDSSGTIDTNFNPKPFGQVYSLAVQADGKILVGGTFSGSQNGILYNAPNLARLNPDGTVDTTFSPSPNAPVYSLAIQADGKILVGGFFTTLAGQTRRYVGRLNANGTLDTAFNLGGTTVTNTGVYTLLLQPDGKTLVGGNFTTLGSQNRTNLGRLNALGTASQALTLSGSTATWTRGGTSPEVQSTTFDSSPDGGTTWTNLGAGFRIAGGWELDGLAVPANTALRARGTVAGGFSGYWFVETVLRPALTISSVAQFGNGHFGFSTMGPFGQAIVVESSPDLKTWTPLQTNTFGADPFPFSDPNPTVLPQQFYRLRQGP